MEEAGYPARPEADPEKLQALLDSFEDGPFPETWICPYDGTLVVDRERHLDFHDSLQTTASEASEAAMFHRPIGGN